MKLHWSLLVLGSLSQWTSAGADIEVQGLHSIDVQDQERTHIISFGDSYSTTKFDSTKKPPSPSCPLGNPGCIIGSPWATHGGHNWISSLTSVHNRSLTLTYNYAVYGDFLDIEINGGNPTKTSVIQHQYPRFLNNIRSGNGSDGIEKDVLSNKNTLFSLWVGINDVAIQFDQITKESQRRVFATNFLEKYFEFARRLSETHKVHNFLLLNIPPIERSPSALRQSVEARAKRKALTDAINDRFPAYIDDFKDYLWENRNGELINVFFYNAHEAFTRILDSPGDYGFSSATDWGSRPTTFWGDTYHPGAYGHAILAREVGQLLEDGGFWSVSVQYNAKKRGYALYAQPGS